MLEYRNSRQFQTKVLNFPEEVYRINDPSTHIFKFMFALLEIGVKEVEIWQEEAGNSESLPGTKYADIDALFGFLGIVRLQNEIFEYDPYEDQLTAEMWNEILTKDSLFRLRVSKFLQAMLRGGTPEGIQMMAEAACGHPVQVFEVWRVMNGRGLAAGLDIERPEQLNLAKEFCIIPTLPTVDTEAWDGGASYFVDDYATFNDVVYVCVMDADNSIANPATATDHWKVYSLDEGQRAAIIHLVDLIKPVNTICTVHESPTISDSEVDVGFSASEDYYFEVRRMVTATDDPIFQDAAIWVQPNQEVEGPTFAMMDHSDTEFALNEAVTSVNVFRVDESYFVDFGVLNGGINASVETAVVTESSEPPAPAFFIKIGNEVMFVSDRVPVVGTDADFTYTIQRGREGTTAASHSDTVSVFTSALSIVSEAIPSGTAWGPWQAVPLADSPDNYPDGKYSGDPSKYDAQGGYVFEYTSQDQFVAWYTTQIESLGGEVSGTRFRTPLGSTSVGGISSKPEDALAPPEFSVQMRVYPERV